MLPLEHSCSEMAYVGLVGYLCTLTAAFIYFDSFLMLAACSAGITSVVMAGLVMTNFTSDSKYNDSIIQIPFALWLTFIFW